MKEALERGFERGFFENPELPPSPTTLKPLTGAASAKNVCKILSRNGLEVKILILNDLLAIRIIVCLTPLPWL